METQGFEPTPQGPSGAPSGGSPFEPVAVPQGDGLSPLDPSWQPPTDGSAPGDVVPGLLPPMTAPATSAPAAMADTPPDSPSAAFMPQDPFGSSVPTALPTFGATTEAPIAEAPAAPAVAAPAAPAAPAGLPAFTPEPLTATVPAAAEPVQASVEVPSQATAVAAEEATDGAYKRTLIEEDSGVEALNLTDLLIAVLELGASDLHLTAGARPAMRINGHLQQMDERPILTPQVIQRMMYAIITQRQREKFEENLELDFAYAVPGKARFRVNLYRQRDALGAAFRLIPYEIKRLEDLGVPPAVANFSMLPRGFVLVTGPTGSGKSTTLASLLDLANRSRKDHIMTVEDPIEFLHRHQSCLVNQREVGEDTHSFQNALKHVLRQDPDIILVGEMRDLETISVALTAAETGHLVYATLHTQDAAQTIDRVIDVFPPHQQQQIRVQLAGALQGIVCQTLCRTSDGNGRVVATEILVATPAIRNLIREGKTHQIYSAMQAGAKFGMHTMDQHLAELVKSGRITYETGLEKCHHVEDFNRLAGRG